MKKLLTSLATIALVGGSIANATAFTKLHAKPNQTTVPKTTQPKTKPTVNAQATTVNPYAIANKLRKKTIKLDPNFWLGKDIHNYQSQLNAQVVKQGILTADEAKYVTWQSFKINVAGWYWTVNFTVSASGATATDNAALNASTGETPAQIAAKLSKATIKFNYNWWHGKDLSANWNQIQQMIVNEHILTKTEASDVVGVAYGDDTIVNPYQIISLGLDVNDNNTVSNATPTVDIMNDGDSAQQIAAAISATDVFRLKPGIQGQYTDSTAAVANIRQEIVYYGILNWGQVGYLQFPHQMLKETNQVAFTATKDGQAVQTASCTVLANNFDNMTRDVNIDGLFQVSVNLTVPTMKYFQSHVNAFQPSLNLGWFYQILDNGQITPGGNIPADPNDPHAFKSGDTLGELAEGFSSLSFSDFNDCASNYADTTNQYIWNFEEALLEQVGKSLSANTPLTVWFSWHEGGGSVPFVQHYGFW